MRSIEELVDRLNEERIWRIKEITLIKTLLEKRSISPPESSILCRSASALCYSHWEGFVKRAAESYLKHIALQRVPVALMAEPLLCLYARQSLSDPKSLSSQQILSFTNSIERKEEFRPRIRWKSVISTNSNLSSTVLKKICQEIGIDYKTFESLENFIDSTVLSKRNAIVHGEKGDLLPSDVYSMGDGVIELISLFKNSIENAATLKTYRRVREVLPAS